MFHLQRRDRHLGSGKLLCNYISSIFQFVWFFTKSNLFLHLLKFSDLLSIAYKASSVLVPNRGWHIFGGGSSRSGKTQKLSGLESEWEEGTDLYNGSDMYGFCSVQVPQKLRLWVKQYCKAKVLQHLIVFWYFWHTFSPQGFTGLKFCTWTYELGYQGC